MDGFRAFCYIEQGAASFLSRNGNVYNPALTARARQRATHARSDPGRRDRLPGTGRYAAIL
jgi:hypothetical protein